MFPILQFSLSRAIHMYFGYRSRNFLHVHKIFWKPVCRKQDIGSSSSWWLPRYTFSISLVQSESFWVHQSLKYSSIPSVSFVSIVWTQSHTHYLEVLRLGRATLFICVYYQWFRVQCLEILVQQKNSDTLQASWHVTPTLEKQTSGSFILSLTF